MNTFREFYSQLLQDPENCWLTLENPSKQKHITYNSLYIRINHYLAYFEKQNINSNDIVLIILKESLDLFASFIAAIIYGAMPAYYPYPSPKQSKYNFSSIINHLLRYNKIRMIVGFPEVIQHLQKEINYNEIELISFKDIKNLEEIKIKLKSNIEENFLQFSSGTTGAKKGVKISISSLNNQIKSYKKILDLNDRSKIVSWLPHYHDMGLICCMILPLFKKIPIIMMSPFEWVMRPISLLENIHKHKGTHVWLPNFSLNHIANNTSEEESSKLDLSSIEKLICCSEPTLFDTVTNFKKKFSNNKLNPLAFQSCYAMAENTFAVSSTKEKGILFLNIDYSMMKKKGKIKIVKNGYRIASVGKPIENNEVRIISNNKKKLPENHVGQIEIRSNCLFSEYYNNPIATKKSFNQEWFITGDLGFIHNRELYITGRKKELIIVGGENIYPQDIEEIINNEKFFIPGRNVAFGLKDQNLGTQKVMVLAEIENFGYEDIDLKTLKEKIFKNLNILIAHLYLLPRGSLKKSTAGKISRHLNKKAYLNGDFDFYIKKIKSKQQKRFDSSRKIKNIINKIVDQYHELKIDHNSKLFEKGYIDSFGFIELILQLESAFQINIANELRSYENFGTLDRIEETIETIIESNYSTFEKKNINNYNQNTKKNIHLKYQSDHQTFKEKLINYFPFKSTFLFKVLLKVMGVKLGNNVQFLGKVYFKIRGKFSNIQFGDNVTIGKRVEIRNRENGRVLLGDRCFLENDVRLVAARDGKIKIGEGTEIGRGVIINSGGNLDIGRYCLIANYVNINSSSHGTNRNNFIKAQKHNHGSIRIEDDVWIGSSASILLNTHIFEGAIIGANSLVSGNVPPYTIYGGIPAKFIRKR